MKLADMIRITNNHGASTNRDKLLLSGSPACDNFSEFSPTGYGDTGIKFKT